MWKFKLSTFCKWKFFCGHSAYSLQIFLKEQTEDYETHPQQIQTHQNACTHKQSDEICTPETENQYDVTHSPSHF
jgi:hypothetical protein